MKTGRPFPVPLLSLVLFGWLIQSGTAAIWKSNQWGCEVNLPDGSPYLDPWYTMVPSPETDALTGARKRDYSQLVYLGLVHLDDKPKFQLNEKTVEELENPFFGGKKGFLHDIAPVTRGKLSGFRLTGTHYYNSRNYEVVIEMYQANGFVYQLAGLTTHELNPLKEPEIRAFMESFRITPIR